MRPRHHNVLWNRERTEKSITIWTGHSSQGDSHGRGFQLCQLFQTAATSLNTWAHITAAGGGHTEQTRTQRDCLVKTFINSLFQLPRHFSFLSIITYPSYINTTLNIVARTVTNLPAIAAEVRFRFNMSYTGLWERRRQVNRVTNPNSVAPLNQGQIFSFTIQRKAGNAMPFLPLLNAC